MTNLRLPEHGRQSIYCGWSARHTAWVRPGLRAYRQAGMMNSVAAIPESTKVSLQQRLTEYAKARWPGLPGIVVRYRPGSPTSTRTYPRVRPSR